MKKFTFEIYTKHPDTIEHGWDIKLVTVFAESYDDAETKVKSYPDFDTIIGTGYCDMTIETQS